MPLPPTEFTPWASLGGGVLIGLAALMVMLLLGRIAGISGIALSALRPAAAEEGDWSWRPAFIAGLVLAPVLYAAAGLGPVVQDVPETLAAMALAGLLVGTGSALGSGCTSGHGVCGLSRLSTRSLVAVPAFMGAAALTVYVLRHVIGGGA